MQMPCSYIFINLTDVDYIATPKKVFMLSHLAVAIVIVVSAAVAAVAAAAAAAAAALFFVVVAYQEG